MGRGLLRGPVPGRLFPALRTGREVIPRSLQPLALIALKEAGADGYAIYQIDPGTEVRELKFAWGVPVPEASQDRFTVGSFPLRVGDSVTGLLMFIFRGGAISSATRA